MATNQEFIASIEQAAATLGIEADTDGLNNTQLGALSKELKAQVAAAEPAPAPEPKPEFAIAEGKSITTMRGILGPGDEIKPEDITGGRKALAGFVKTGFVVKA